MIKGLEELIQNVRSDVNLNKDQKLAILYSWYQKMNYILHNVSSPTVVYNAASIFIKIKIQIQSIESEC